MKIVITASVPSVESQIPASFAIKITQEKVSLGEIRIVFLNKIVSPFLPFSRLILAGGCPSNPEFQSAMPYGAATNSPASICSTSASVGAEPIAPRRVQLTAAAAFANVSTSSIGRPASRP